MDAFADIETVDCHLHLRELDGVEQLPAILEAADLAALCVQSLTARKDHSVIQNALSLLAKLTYPDRIYAFGGLIYPEGRPTAGDLATQARRLRDLGFDGIKMIEGKPTAHKRVGIPLDDTVYDAYWAWVQSEQFPVLWHVADPETFWDPDACPPSARKKGWAYWDGTFATKEELYQQVDHVLERFDRLRIIFAHFYFLSADLPRAAAFLDKWPGAHFDITPGSEMYFNFSADPEAWRGFFWKYRSRILFGTDNDAPGDPTFAGRRVREMQQFLAERGSLSAFGKEIQGLGLQDEALRAIAAENFRRLAGEAPRPVDPPMAVAYCDSLIAQADSHSMLASRKDALEAIRDRVAAFA